MPRYKNNGSETRNLPGVGEMAPGASIDVPWYPRGAHPDFIITDHDIKRTPTPVRLFEGPVTGGSGTITGLNEYDSFSIYNATDATITVTYNEDTANAVTYPAGFFGEIDVLGKDGRPDYYSLSITGSGTGTVYVHGMR